MDATAVNQASNWQIGELLIKEGFVKRADIEAALKAQKEETWVSIDKALVEKGLITEEHLFKLTHHKDFQEALGRLAVEKGLIDDGQLAQRPKNYS